MGAYLVQHPENGYINLFGLELLATLSRRFHKKQPPFAHGSWRRPLRATFHQTIRQIIGYYKSRKTGGRRRKLLSHHFTLNASPFKNRKPKTPIIYLQNRVKTRSQRKKGL
jgi:hypothetical protein